MLSDIGTASSGAPAKPPSAGGRRAGGQGGVPPWPAGMGREAWQAF
jgi:hypothetical protein